MEDMRKTSKRCTYPADPSSEPSHVSSVSDVVKEVTETEKSC